MKLFPLIVGSSRRREGALPAGERAPGHVREQRVHPRPGRVPGRLALRARARPRTRLDDITPLPPRPQW